MKSGKNKGQFRFTLCAANGQVVATSHQETYNNLRDCEDTIWNNFDRFEIHRMF